MKRTAPVALLTFALVLGAFPALAEDTISFGAAVSLTGKTAKEGEYTRDGYNFAVETLNAQGGIAVGGKKYKIAVKYYDDESKSERTAQLIEKLINEDKVTFILGPYGSAPTGTAAPICEKYKIPMVEANGSAESIFSKGYKYTFAVLSPAKLYLKGVIDLVMSKDKSVRTVAVLGENEPFSKEVASGAADYAREKGLQVVYQELYPTGTQDVSALLTNIKGKNPDIVLGAGHLQDSLLIVKQAKDLGVSPKAMGFSVGPSSPEFRENLKTNADYIFGSTQWTEALKYNGSDPWKTPKGYAEAFRAKNPKYKDIPYQVAGVLGRRHRVLPRDREGGHARPGEGTRRDRRPGHHDVLRPDQIRQPRHQHVQADGDRAAPAGRPQIHGLPVVRGGKGRPVPDAGLGQTEVAA